VNPDDGSITDGAEERGCVAWHPDGDCLVNLAGDYDYLELGYYTSQDREAAGRLIHPTLEEALDAYVPPLFLEKGRLAGLKVPEFYISNGYFEPPVIIDPINPFMIKSRLVLKPGRERAIARSMTRNFTYAICCQELAEGATVAYFRSVLGWSSSARFRALSEMVWSVYRIPLARVRVIQTPGGGPLLSDIGPLPFRSLKARELAHLEAKVQWEE
jgi:hypothetical protein